MDNSITDKSPAKINLFLKILNRREDNYHNIRTLQYYDITILQYYSQQRALS